MQPENIIALVIEVPTFVAALCGLYIVWKSARGVLIDHIYV